MQSPSTYFKYFLFRCARILPLYWLILTIYYLDKEYGKFHFSALTYTLAHGFSDAHNLDGLAQAWSLTVEMSFYLIAPILFFIKKRNLLLLLSTLVILFLAFWGIGVYWQHLNKNPDRFFMPIHFLLNSSFPGRSSEFLAGMILATAVQNKSKVLQQFKYKTLSGFLLMFLTIYGIGWFQADQYDHGYAHTGGMILSKTLLPATMIVLFAGLIYEDTWVSKLLGNKFFVLLGNASFAFYLVHISYVNLKLKDWHTFSDRNFFLLWLISIMLYQFFEHPIYSLVRKKIVK